MLLSGLIDEGCHVSVSDSSGCLLVLDGSGFVGGSEKSGHKHLAGISSLNGSMYDIVLPLLSSPSVTK